MRIVRLQVCREEEISMAVNAAMPVKFQYGSESLLQEDSYVRCGK